MSTEAGREGLGGDDEIDRELAERFGAPVLRIENGMTAAELTSAVRQALGLPERPGFDAIGRRLEQYLAETEDHR